MTGRLQLLHDTAANWTSADSILLAGELGIETDTGQFKIGDGSTAWTSLPYAGGGSMALDDLTDVNAPAPTDQYVLTWDNGTSKWIAATPAGGAPTGSAGGELAGSYPNPTVAATHSGSAHHDPVTVGTGLDVTGQLVELDLSEVAAGGELGGTMDAPTVDATHSGSAHTDFIAKAFLNAKGDLISASADNTPALLTAGSDDTILMADSAAGAGLKWAASATPSDQAFGDTAAVGTGDTFTRGDHKHGMPANPVTAHEAAGDPHTGYRLESADHSHASTGLQAGKIAQSASHESPDTDSGSSSLHHTLGTGAAQAAAGNHTHAGGAGVATDTIWDAAGDLAVGTGADTAAKLAISVPAANVRNVLGVDNGETTWSVKAMLDGTNPAALGTVAPGTALTAAHRDHVHPTTGLITSGAKITALSSLTPTTDDIVPIVDDPGGTPVTKKATLASIITLAGSANNPAALGTAAAGTSGNKMSRDDHVHPTTGLVTTTIEVVGGGTDIAINDTNYVTLATTTFDIAAGNLFIAELDFLILNNSGATKTYTTVFDVNGFLVENVDGTTHGANATNRAPHTVRASCEVRATNLAYSWITNEWTTPGGANVSSNPSLSQLTRTWNSTTGNATGSSATVRIRIKSSNATATQTATVLGWRIRKI